MAEELVIRRRDILYPRIEMRTGHLELILPHGADETEVLEKHREWIEKRKEQIAQMEQRAEHLPLQERTQSEYAGFVKTVVQKKLGDAADNTKIVLRRMKSKWASCAESGTITLNTLGKDLPDRCLEYIISHELLHLTHRKHDTMFLTTMRCEFPDMEELEKDLAGYWFKLNA